MRAEPSARLRFDLGHEPALREEAGPGPLQGVAGLGLQAFAEGAPDDLGGGAAEQVAGGVLTATLCSVSFKTHMGAGACWKSA